MIQPTAYQPPAYYVTVWLMAVPGMNFLLLNSIKQMQHYFQGFPGGDNGKEPACPCGRHKRHQLDPWVGKIP